jgi:hypothetical protein
MKIQKLTAEVFKLNDLKYNFITYAKQSILSDQNYGIAVFFFFFLWRISSILWKETLREKTLRQK